MKTEVLIWESAILDRVKRMGEEITNDYYVEGVNLLLLCVLKGGVVFLSDLMRAIKLPLDIGFIEAKSYGDSMYSTGKVELNFITPVFDKLRNYDVIVVEDIMDTGLTFGEIERQLRGRCRSLAYASLLVKDKDQGFPIDYIGYTIPDVFVVGYGLDAQNQFRNLPDIEVVL